MLDFDVLYNGSSSKYKITLFENYFLKCYKVKRILISFNCFSEYIYNIITFTHEIYYTLLFQD